MLRALADTLRAGARRYRLAIELLLGRRPGLYLAADGLILFGALVAVLVGGGRGPDVYNGLVLLPTLLLGLPALSDVVALERRAGSLDLALSSPAPWYFERRVAAAGAFLVAQAWVLLTANWLAGGMPFPLVPPLVQSLLFVVTLGSIALFWAVRVRTPGAVAFATLVTLVALGRWTSSSPFAEEPRGRLLPPLEDALPLAVPCVVLGLTSTVAWLHARRRLDRPETMLS